MKTFNLIAGLLILIGTIIFADAKLGKTVPMEIGIVAHKTFSPPGNYHPVKAPAPFHTIVIIQTDKRRGYFMNVPRDYFYDIDVGDRVPLAKRYGLFTGWEWEQKLLLN